MRRLLQFLATAIPYCSKRDASFVSLLRSSCTKRQLISCREWPAGRRFSTIQYQCVAKRKLPKPPVPDLSQTLSTYLEYARVLAANPEEYGKTKAYVDDFATRDGPALQVELQALAEKTENWVNLFWLPDMYLKGRLPLPVYSNPAYVFPDKNFEDIEDMVRYVSHFICGVYNYKDNVDKRVLPMDKSTGKDSGHPLCMEQYWRLFTSYRVPQVGSDHSDPATHRDLKGNEHIIVACNNQYFQVQTVVQGERLSQVEINKQLIDIFDMVKENGEEMEPIGLLTACNRDKAAEARIMLEKDPHNKANLEAIRTSTFFVCFDKPAPGILSENGESHAAARAMHMLHGNSVNCNTANRWYNKTIQFIFAPDGACGMNYEHSVGEALAVINPVEEALQYVESKVKQKTIGTPRSHLKPKPLVWNIPSEVHNLIENCKEEVEKLVKDLDFVLLQYRGFGREFPKSKGISPDAFIQLTLQLAYYRCHGRLVSTYESATLRRFRQGRVDNVRAATPEALTWVTIMDDQNVTLEQQKAAFRTAMEKHTKVMHQNLTGHGIDNHLIALRELASHHLPSLPAIFTDPLFKELFRFLLSTSQVPTRLPGTFMCYGPVEPDGYGCGYNPRADEILFMISSLKSCAETNSRRFRNTIERTLDEMKHFL